MTKFGFAAVVASGLTAAILGLAAPAQAATAVNASCWVKWIED